jgi:hypothetical protein
MTSPHHIPPTPARTAPQHLYVEAPAYYYRQPVDPPSVYLAGETGTDPWQTQAAAALKAAGPLVVLNPNRARRPTPDLDTAWKQTSWEQRHLHLADLTLIWFPATTDAPLAMFHLGQALGEGRPLIVGAEPGSPREPDVYMLCQLTNPAVPVYSDLFHVISEAITALQTDTEEDELSINNDP